MAAEMAVSPVEIRIKNLPEGFPRRRPDPLRPQIHHNRGREKIRAVPGFRKDEVRRKFTRPGVIRPQIEGKFRPVLPPPALSAQQQPSARCQLGIQAGLERLVHPDVVGEDQEFEP